IDAAFSMKIGSNCFQFARRIPKWRQRAFRREDQGPTLFLVEPVFILQPEIEGAVPRMAVALRAGCIRNVIANFDVIQKSATLPTATGTFESGGKQIVTDNH